MRTSSRAALTIAAPIGTVGALLLVIGCLATERDRGQALADGIRAPADAGTSPGDSSGGAASISTTPGNAVRNVGGVGAQ